MVNDNIVVWVIAYALSYFLMVKSSKESFRILGWLAFGINGIAGMSLLDADPIIILPAMLTVLIAIVKLYNIFTGVEDVKDKRSWLTT